MRRINILNLELQEILQILSMTKKRVLINFYKNNKNVGYIYLDENGYITCLYEEYKDYDALDNLILEQRLLDAEIIFDPIVKDEFIKSYKIPLLDYIFHSILSCVEK